MSYLFFYRGSGNVYWQIGMEVSAAKVTALLIFGTGIKKVGIVTISVVHDPVPVIPLIQIDGSNRDIGFYLSPIFFMPIISMGNVVGIQQCFNMQYIGVQGAGGIGPAAQDFICLSFDLLVAGTRKRCHAG